MQQIRAIYHRFFSEDMRLKFYESAPQFIRRWWDRLGESVGKKYPNINIIDVKDVHYAILLFWQKEPQPAEIENHYQHAHKFRFNLNQLTHEMMHNHHANQPHPPLQDEPVPTDQEIIYYCYRLILKREPLPGELRKWMRKMENNTLTYGQLVSSFFESSEYQALRAREHQPFLVELEKFKIFVRWEDYFTSGPIVRNKKYESHNTQLMAEIVRPGDYVLDVGANVGYHALHMATLVGEHGRLFAFEPHIGNCELIELSVQENQLGNLQLFPYAAGAEEGELQLMIVGNHTNARLLTRAEFDDPNSEKQVVKVVVIDELLVDIPRLNFAKIDVEGAEPLVLRGMRSLIQRFKPVLFFEFFPPFIEMTSQADPAEFLQEVIDYGYDLQVIAKGPQITRARDARHAMQIFNADRNHLVDILATPISS